MRNHLKPGTGQPSIAERVAHAQANATARENAPMDHTPANPGTHVYVTTPDGIEVPGLLVEWAQGASGWEGRVIYVMEVRTGRNGVVDEWVPAEGVRKRE